MIVTEKRRQSLRIGSKIPELDTKPAEPAAKPIPHQPEPEENRLSRSVSKSIISSRKRSSSAAPSHRYSYTFDSQTQRYSYDDSHLHFRRREKTELAIRQEMFKDFTFRPKIKPIPKFYGVIPQDPSPFYARVMKWKRDQEDEADKRRFKQDRAMMQDCTFQPKYVKYAFSIHSLSCRSSIPPRRMGEVERLEEATNTNERLYHEFDELLAVRQEERERSMLMREQLEQQECTFRPVMKSFNPQYLEVRPKYADSVDKPNYDELKVKLETRECTFAPKVICVTNIYSKVKLKFL